MSALDPVPSDDEVLNAAALACVKLARHGRPILEAYALGLRSDIRYALIEAADAGTVDLHSPDGMTDHSPLIYTALNRMHDEAAEQARKIA